MDTCESRISQRLYSQTSAQPSVSILTWNPPDHKSYQTANLQLPYIDGGRRLRSRLDAIWAAGDCLFLVELKCRSSESAADIKKLRRIRDDNETETIVTLLRRQGAEVSPEVTQLALVIGVEQIDSPIPPDFIVLQVGQDSSATYFGAQVPENIARAIQRAFAST